MKQDIQNIVEGNKIIAEFMQYEHCTDPDHKDNLCYAVPYAKGYHRAHQLQHHSSWDWLKPVIDEIFKYSIAFPEQTKPIREMKIVVEIQPAWERCVQFIQWYNSTQQKQVKE